jgi:CxxC motif-containing protein
MTEKTIICTVCPRGCHIDVTGEGTRVDTINGFSCKRGERYATDEFILPKRIFTTTVKIDGASEPLLPVRSDAPVPKAKLFEIVAEVRKIQAVSPVRIGDVIVKNVLGLGVDIVACRNI